jgi:hypothetical protein
MKIAFEDNESIGDVSVYADISNSSHVWREGVERDERLAQEHVPMIDTSKRPK